MRDFPGKSIYSFNKYLQNIYHVAKRLGVRESMDLESGDLS